MQGNIVDYNKIMSYATHTQTHTHTHFYNRLFEIHVN